MQLSGMQQDTQLLEQPDQSVVRARLRELGDSITADNNLAISEMTQHQDRLALPSQELSTDVQSLQDSNRRIGITTAGARGEENLTEGQIEFAAF
jgi:hypothetical protein